MEGQRKALRGCLLLLHLMDAGDRTPLPRSPLWALCSPRPSSCPASVGLTPTHSRGQAPPQGLICFPGHSTEGAGTLSLAAPGLPAARCPALPAVTVYWETEALAKWRNTAASCFPNCPPPRRLLLLNPFLAVGLGGGGMVVVGVTDRGQGLGRLCRVT